MTGAVPAGRRAPILSLPPGPIDVIGDVHGQRAALQRLLGLLGYGADGRHPDGRRLLFVGDLGDRGPDSPAVFELVMAAVAGGGAVCVLGNHELALLGGDDTGPRPGNAWFFGGRRAAVADARDFGPFTPASSAERERIAAFCDQLPVAIRHTDCNVVHACWHAASIDFIGGPAGASNRQIAATCAALAAGAAERGDPLHLLTSGPEPAGAGSTGASDPRFRQRRPWWNEQPPAQPTVIGHYWRQRRYQPLPFDQQRALFGSAAAAEWLGPGRTTMCIDFCWPGDWRRPALAALRPDLGQLVFWDGERIASRRQR